MSQVKMAIHSDSMATKVFYGDVTRGREFIEDLLMKEIGYSPMLQEDEEEGNIYLHSEYWEDLSEEEIEEIDKLGFSEDVGNETIKAIEKIAQVSIRFFN